MSRKKYERDFKVVYDTYCNLVMKIASSLVQDYVLAQDICQEVFVRYCEKGIEIEDDFLRAWFIVNTKRKAIDYMRRSYQKHEMVDMYDADLANKTKSSGADDLINNVIRKDMTYRFLRELEEHNPDWYKIVIGVMVDKRPEKEIARELNMSSGNLRAKLHRAKIWIRENYREEYEDLL